MHYAIAFVEQEHPASLRNLESGSHDQVGLNGNEVALWQTGRRHDAVGRRFGKGDDRGEIDGIAPHAYGSRLTAQKIPVSFKMEETKASRSA